MAHILVAIPVVLGILSFFIKADGVRRTILLLGVALHSGCVIAAWMSGDYKTVDPEAWLALDGIGLLFLAITSTIFLFSGIYAVGYLAREEKGWRKDFVEGEFFKNTPEQLFGGCYLLFLGAMTLVTVSQHMGLLWVAVEATTLASAPLIAFHRHHRSLEAMWKYLIICSVGIALALLGTLTLGAVAGSVMADAESPLVLSALLLNAWRMDTVWLEISFILLLVGYGTKMGLSPFHTWLPDAHSEGPSVVSALLSGSLLNIAFIGIIRGYQILEAAGLTAFAGKILVAFGLLSMAFAATFIIRQRNFKRMLAYSSIEHMGIMAIGIGIGGAGIFGAALHAVNHSLVKAMLFLTSGNILNHYKTTKSKDVHGMLDAIPVTGSLWLMGFFAITGTPPFGLFISEFTILKAILDGGFTLTAVLYIFFLVVIFIAMSIPFFKMAQSPPPEGEPSPALANPGESFISTFSPVVLAGGALVLGLYIPSFLKNILDLFAQMLGGGL